MSKNTTNAKLANLNANSLPSGQAQDIASRGFGQAGITLHMPEAPALDVPDIVARFQLETEAALEGIRREHRAQLVEQERKIAKLEDAWSETRTTVKALATTVEDALHQMQTGIAEALNAQRVSMAAATRAESSAAVFDKLKASQPDFHATVRGLEKVVASVRDSMTLLEEQVRGYSKRLDELDAVAVDYEDTKGAVRGIDTIVKDLNASERQRRQVSGRGAQ